MAENQNTTMTAIYIHISRQLDYLIELVVSEGAFPNKSDFVRFAIRKQLQSLGHEGKPTIIVKEVYR